MAPLSISLLGSFRVTQEGKPLASFRYDKVRALLAYLTVESNRAHRREALLGLLWPELPEETARTNLRQALATLRTAIDDRAADPPYLLVSRESIQWNPASDSEVDVLTFQALIADCSDSPATCKYCEPRLVQAANLYQGDFLDQFFLPDSAPFEEWALVQRESLQRQALEALGQLARCLELRGELKQAEKYTHRQL